MVIDQIFSSMDGSVLALVSELRRANRERNALRRGMQIIVDLHGGGVAEEIARQMLEEFVERRENDCIAVGQFAVGEFADWAGRVRGSVDHAAG